MYGQSPSIMKICTFIISKFLYLLLQSFEICSWNLSRLFVFFHIAFIAYSLIIMHNVIIIGYIITSDDGRLLDLICCSKLHGHFSENYPQFRHAPSKLSPAPSVAEKVYRLPVWRGAKLIACLGRSVSWAGPGRKEQLRSCTIPDRPFKDTLDFYGL